jgi:DNA-directed RNA polymerase subunit RPC12/RpoP
MTCKGICARHKALRPADGFGRYSAGQKICRTCGVFMKWDGGMWCPCCGGKLRAKPRNTVDRRRAAAMALSNASSNSKLQQLLALYH